jgi:hypothetical protein
MSLFAAWFLYPLALLALCGGLGLLVDVLAGRPLPGVLVVPSGLAAMVLVGQFTTLADATAGLTAPLICFLAVLGAGLSLPWRFRRPDPWPIAVALVVFVIFGAPVLFSGHPTFAGYIKLDDTATWLALTDRVMEHGRDLGGLEPSSYLATLEVNLPGGYPIGIFVPFGTAQRLVGGDLAWVFQPYLALLAANLSLCLWRIFGGLLKRPPARALVALLAAQPALLYGYAMWGGVKELGAAVFVALTAALAAAAARGTSRRGAALLALPAGALVGVLGVGGLVWLAPMLGVLFAVLVSGPGQRAAVRQSLAFAATLAVAVVPVLFIGGFNPFQAGLTSESERGNLVGPLDPVQALGIWPSGDFRLDPSAGLATAVLIALGLFAAALGLWSAWRSRALAPLLFATALLGCGAIIAVGSPWVDGKALATVAPVVLGLAISGAVLALRIDRFAGAALVTAVAAGVIWSNVLAYGGVSLAPYGQLHELQQIGADFAGQGPALMTEYNPYGARHFLRGLDGEGVSELRARSVPLVTGGSAEKGESVDTDRIVTAALLEYPTLVLRRSPLRSRPPSLYRLVWAGRYYEVWQRPPIHSGFVPLRLPLGDRSNPVAIPSCYEVSRLAQIAASKASGAARLLAAHHAPAYDATDGILHVPVSARYAAWLGGSVRGGVTLFVDGKEIGEARHQLEEDGGFVELGQTRLDRGSHRVELRFGGADLHPGSGGFPRPEIGPLLFSSVDEEVGELVSIPPPESSRLCGRSWDWIEAVN